MIKNMPKISFEEFEKVDIRCGTIVKVEPFPRARKPAYKVWVDFGSEVGVKQTSAQITVHYQPDELIGRQVQGVLNLGSRNIAGFTSEFLLTGYSDSNGAICLTQISPEAVNGSALH